MTTKNKTKQCPYRPSSPTDRINPAAVKRILGLLDKGLTLGLGKPVPGKMCVEAAVSYAMGYDHDDKPSCVADIVSDFKISLNDNGFWPSNKARANGLRSIAIAQLGSAELNDDDIIAAFQFEAKLLLCKLAALPPKSFSDGLQQRRYVDWLVAYDDEHSYVAGEALEGALEDQFDNFSRASARRLGYKGKSGFVQMRADAGTRALVRLRTKGSRYLNLVK